MANLKRTPITPAGKERGPKANVVATAQTVDPIVDRMNTLFPDGVNDLTIADDVTITDDLSVGGDLAVTGALDVNGAVTLDGTTALTGVLTAVGIVQAPVFVADATPYTVLAANSGKMHIILEQTSNITLNLPVIAAGLNYKFIMGGVATEAQNWIIVATTPSFYNGGVLWTDLNDAENNVGAVYGNGTSHLTLTVTTPGVGTEIEIYSNGTEWFVHGNVISDSTPAFT